MSDSLEDVKGIIIELLDVESVEITNESRFREDLGGFNRI